MNTMNPPEDNDPLDALLREENPHVSDNGFTARVMASLPSTRSLFRWQQWILIGAAIIGQGLAAWWLPWKDLTPQYLSVLVSHNFQALWPWAVVLCVMGSLLWAVIAAIQWED